MQSNTHLRPEARRYAKCRLARRGMVAELRRSLQLQRVKPADGLGELGTSLIRREGRKDGKRQGDSTRASGRAIATGPPRKGRACKGFRGREGARQAPNCGGAGCLEGF